MSQLAVLLSIAVISSLPSLSILSDQLVGDYSGRYTNVKVGSDGLPFIVFNNEKAGGASAVHCEDKFCTNVTHTVIDGSSNPNNARFIIMKMNPFNKYPQLTYSEQGKTSLDSSLKIATCLNVTCSSYTVVTLLKGNLFTEPAYSDFVFDKTGLPNIIAFVQGEGLLLLICNDLKCSSFSKRKIDSGSQNGKYPSIIPSSSGYAFVYQDKSHLNGDLRYTIYNTTSDKKTVGTINKTSKNDIGRYSFAVQSGLDRLSGVYLDSTTGGWFFEYCVIGSELMCNLTQIDNIGVAAYGVFPEVDFYPSLSPFPIISYFNSSSATTGCLKLAFCDSELCQSPDIHVLQNGTTGYGRDSSIAYSHENNLIYVSYLFYNGGDDKKAMLMTLKVNPSK